MPKHGSEYRVLTSCDRGAPELRPVLHLAYPPAAQSTLVLTFPGGLTCEVNLPARYTHFLRHAAEAWEQDAGKVEKQRGYRTKCELRRIVRNPTTKKIVSATTVGQYVKEIRKELRKKIVRALASLDLPEGYETEIPNLIEGERYRGYRIGPCGLVILEAREPLLLYS
jgi:hypothetical protein